MCTAYRQVVHDIWQRDIFWQATEIDSRSKLQRSGVQKRLSIVDVVFALRDDQCYEVVDSQHLDLRTSRRDTINK